MRDTADPLLDPDLPNRLRAMAADLEQLAHRTRTLAKALPPPPFGVPLAVAHAYAADVEEQASAFIAWVDSASFPAVAAGERDRFRTAAGRLVTAARRLGGAATERRRVDELIERAGEAFQQAGALFAKANAAVMRDLQAQVEAITAGRR